MKEVSPKEAFEKLEKEPQAIYLDVRSVPEFQQGHPVRAINIPLLHYIPAMGMAPNNDFLSVVQANIPRDALLLIGCKTGGRSAHACEILSQNGYTNVMNVRCGFLGAMDPLGRVSEPGWSLLNLPTCTNCSEECQYSTLEKKII